MDVRGSVGYRTVELNVATVTPQPPIGGGIDGVVVNEVDYSDVDVVQHMDKAANRDGIDVADPFLGGRTMNITGTIYETEQGLFHDLVQTLRAAFNPRLAFLDDPTMKGFQPFTFSVPTKRWSEFPTRQLDLLVYLIPRSFKVAFDRKEQGGATGEAMGTIWRAQLFARDPVVYAAALTTVAVANIPEGGTLLNRGDYPATVDFVFTVGTAAGFVSLQIGAALVTFTVPVGSVNRVFRYDSKRGLLYVTDGGFTTLRMDLMNAPLHLTISPGGSGYSYNTDLASVTGTITYRESYA